MGGKNLTWGSWKNLIHPMMKEIFLTVLVLSLASSKIKHFLVETNKGSKGMKNFSVETNKGSEGCSNQFDAETCELLESILNLVCDTPAMKNTSRCEAQKKALALKGCNKGTDYSGSVLWKMLDVSRCELDNCCSC